MIYGKRILHHAAFIMSCVVCVAVLSGCETTSSSIVNGQTDDAGSSAPAYRTRDFAELNLLQMPYALDLDKDLIPDAIAIQVFAVKLGKAKGSDIVHGELEITLFDGFRKGEQTDDSLRIIKRQTYTAEDLKPFAQKSLLGISYHLLLRWDKENAPKEGKVTLRARYTDPQGGVLYSSDNVVPVGA